MYVIKSYTKDKKTVFVCKSILHGSMWSTNYNDVIIFDSKEEAESFNHDCIGGSRYGEVISWIDGHAISLTQEVMCL